MKSVFHRLYIDRDFSLLLISRFISQFGDTLFLPAVYWLAISTDGGTTKIGILSVFMAIPPFLSGVVGVIVDRMSPKKLMIFCDFLRLLLCVILFANMVYWKNFWILVLLVFLIEFIGQFFGIASQSFIPSVVGDENILKANSFFRSTENITSIVGFACGGVIVAVLGSTPLVLGNGLSFLFSGLILCGIKIRLDRRQQKQATMEGSQNQLVKFWQEFLYGLKIAFTNKMIATLLFTALFVNMASASMDMLIALWAENVLHLGSSAFGFLLTALLVGSLAGSLLINIPFIQKMNSFHLIALSLGLNGVCLSLISNFPNLYADVFLFFVEGIMLSLTSISFITILMKSVDKEHTGKLFGIIQTVTRGGQPLGIWIVTTVLGIASISHIVLVIGLLTVVGGGYLYLFFTKELRAQNNLAKQESKSAAS